MAQAILAHDKMLAGTQRHHPAWTASFTRLTGQPARRPTLSRTLRLWRTAPNDYVRGYLAGLITLEIALGDSAPGMLNEIAEVRAEFHFFREFAELLDADWLEQFEVDDPDVRSIDELAELAGGAAIDYMQGYLLSKLHFRVGYLH
jgi:hypothetical protein